MQAEAPRGGAGGEAAERDRLDIAAGNESVRSALWRLLSGPTLSGVDVEARGRLEIVLAEVLNNIVEHAYRGDEGSIRLDLHRRGALLRVEVEDRGLPMPGGLLPQGLRPDLNGADGPPEGGFGWFLIRNLTEDLTYSRDGEVNRVCFHLRIK